MEGPKKEPMKILAGFKMKYIHVYYMLIIVDYLPGLGEKGCTAKRECTAI